MTAPPKRLRTTLRREAGPTARDPVVTHAPPPAHSELQAPASVIHDRIDVRAQFALLRLFKSPKAEDRRDAIVLFHAVDSGEIRGIFGDDLGIAAEIAEARKKKRWELVPDDRDAFLLDDGLPEAPVVLFKESATRPKGRLDQALLRVSRELQPTPKFKPPEGATPPKAFMKADFVPEFKKPKAEARPNPHLETGIKFPTLVAGFTGTRGWVFHVQNVLQRVAHVRLTRGGQSRTCQSRVPSQALDTDYPYDDFAKITPLNPTHHSVARFTGEGLSIRPLTTSDGPRMTDPDVEQPDYRIGDVLTLSTTQDFRMFIVWDPSTEESLPTHSDARPISLGFVDWGWQASASFRRTIDHGADPWRLIDDSLTGSNRGGGVYTPTPQGKRVQLHPLVTDNKLTNQLASSCSTLTSFSADDAVE